VAGRRHEKGQLERLLDRREGSKQKGCEEVNRTALLDEAVVMKLTLVKNKLLNVEGLKYVQYNHICNA
jgi:hypothetical protein